MAQDYSKLTVAKLKEELDKRGLQKTGLKAALVQRLEEADTQAESQQAAPDEEPAEALDTDEPKARSDVKSDAPSEVVPPSKDGESESPGAVPDRGATDETIIDEALKTATRRVHAKTGETQSPKGLPGKASDQPSRKEQPHGSLSPLRQSTSTQNDILPGNLTQTASREGTGEEHLVTPMQTQNETAQSLGLMSTQTSSGPEELAEDSRKRKRRSQSPPPSSVEAWKKLKSETASDVRPDVKLPGDPATQDTTVSQVESQPNGHDEETKPSETRMPDAPPAPTNEVDAKATENVETTSQTPRFRSRTPSPQKPPSSAIGPSPLNRRFASLTNPSTPPSSELSSRPFTIEHPVPPSLHPATPALYIRNLMRPLNPTTFRAHLTRLAHPSPPPSSPEDPITTLHIDAIRSHTLVLFASTGAASRVRAQLHNVVWPNERARKSLWVDYIPPNKVQEWLETENAAGGARAGGKKWEVVYEANDEGEVEARLQEVDANGVPAQGANPIPTDGAAKATETMQERRGGGEERSEEFKALDDLFESTTTAKPKLYYLPVDKSIAGKRLDVLRKDRNGGQEGHGDGSGAGGGRDEGGEMRRFTFEKDDIVDKGPEFGYGRGGRGRRGGYRGRGGGGGGGYRGDGYRGGGGRYRGGGGRGW